MARVKDTNVIRTPEVIIQPIFNVPDDVIDIRAAKESEIQFNPVPSIDDEIGLTDSETGESTTGTSVGGDGGADTTGGTGSSSGVGLSIYSEKSRVTGDGTTVVDIVFQTTKDSPSGYEWRLSTG